MKKDEIKALINREVTKQGRNIVGDGLAKILTALAEHPKTLNIDKLPSSSDSPFSGTLQEVLAYLGLNEEQFDGLMAGEYDFLRESQDGFQLSFIGNRISERGYKGIESACFLSAGEQNVVIFGYDFLAAGFGIRINHFT